LTNALRTDGKISKMSKAINDCVSLTRPACFFAYSIHIAGFVFGAAFALIMKFSKYEEEHINPKIEAMVSFSAVPAVTQAKVDSTEAQAQAQGCEEPCRRAKNVAGHRLTSVRQEQCSST
jgi:hypothetical protein